MKAKIHTGMAEIPAEAWNALVEDRHPFLRHEFLLAMERHGCVGQEFGWLPRHIAVYEDGELCGAMPLYEKYNSYGEFVFDQAWANAWQQSGLAYFPKLVCAVPYTPATGPRLLARPCDRKKIYVLLFQAAQEYARQMGVSGLHWLFPNTPAQQWLATQGLVARHDCQFHWVNRDYQNFDAFVAELSAKKRKNIRQERRKVSQAGIHLRCLDGHTATLQDWQHFALFYEKTFAEKWGIPTFNLGFFLEIAQTLPEQIVLVMADYRKTCIAGALMYRSDTTLYGRHWGCTQAFDSLHFEVCYYQGIAYCLRHGLQCFEPGAQGEHKLARGFLPVRTQSFHWLRPNPFQQAIQAFAQQEKAAIDQYIVELQARSPYKTKNLSLR